MIMTGGYAIDNSICKIMLIFVITVLIILCNYICLDLVLTAGVADNALELRSQGHSMTLFGSVYAKFPGITAPHPHKTIN